MTKIKGTIEIDVERRTVTIRLENGAYCVDIYPHGADRFLADEINYALEGKRINWGNDDDDMYPVGYTRFE